MTKELFAGSSSRARPLSKDNTLSLQRGMYPSGVNSSSINLKKLILGLYVGVGYRYLVMVQQRAAQHLFAPANHRLDGSEGCVHSPLVPDTALARVT